MKRLSILRHAKAAPHGSTDSDFDRPLAPRGRDDIETFCRWARERLKPDLALVSTASRTRETFELLQAGLGRTIPAREVAELYLAETEAIYDALRSAGEAAEVLLVGHNPGLEDLAVRVLGEDLELPTCGFLQIDLPIDDWKRLDRKTRGELIDSREP